MEPEIQITLSRFFLSLFLTPISLWISFIPRSFFVKRKSLLLAPKLYFRVKICKKERSHFFYTALEGFWGARLQWPQHQSLCMVKSVPWQAGIESVPGSSYVWFLVAVRWEGEGCFLTDSSLKTIEKWSTKQMMPQIKTVHLLPCIIVLTYTAMCTSAHRQAWCARVQVCGGQRWTSGFLPRLPSLA